MQHLYAQFLAHPTQACALFLIGFWLLVYLTIQVSHLIARRPLSDGPSLIPVVPILPAIALGIAAAFNAILPPFGTVLVVLFHFGYLIWRFFQMRRENNK